MCLASLLVTIFDVNDNPPSFVNIDELSFNVAEIAANMESEFVPGTIELYARIIVNDGDESGDSQEYNFDLTYVASTYG